MLKEEISRNAETPKRRNVATCSELPASLLGKGLLMLEALRPKASTSLKELTRLTRSDAQHRLYPSALDETVLLCLARDLRMVECLSFEEGELDAPLAPSLFVVCELLMRPGTKYHSSGQFQMTESGLARAIKVLQCAIEREIVSRIVGVSSELNEDDFFLAELDLSQSEEGTDR